MTARALAWIEPHDPLPAPESALCDPPGLLAAGRDLGPARLIEAYSQGIFPWFSEGQPVLWWSPDPRMVLFVDDFRLSRSLRQHCRRMHRAGRWSVSLDRAFDSVIDACASVGRAGQSGTWITPEIRQSYRGLHRSGHAHSVEIWLHDGGPEPTLIGGLYGVSIGRMFFGESMFSLRPDASKAALGALVKCLRMHGFRVIDCQQATRHLASLGAREIGRDSFQRLVRETSLQPSPDWRAMNIELPLA